MMREDGTGKIQAPTRDLRDQLSGVIAIDGRVTGAVPIGLSADFRVAVVFTAMPFEPQDEGRLYKHTVNPSHLDGVVQNHYDAKGGSGPDWHIIVPQTLLTAWYGLKNTVEARRGSQILFGFEGQPGDDRNDVEGYAVLNDDYIIPAMARAIAAAQWSAFLTMRQGSRTVHLNPGVSHAGPIASIVHNLAPDGRLTTTIQMPSEPQPVDPLALIPQAYRPIILGQVPGVP